MGTGNGTVGTEDGEEKKTYVVTVIDKTNVIIPDCDVYIGESNNLVVDLADGVKPTRENPVIVTVTDQNGNAQKDVTVIALGDADFIEKGMTDVYGKLTLPTASDGYTDDDGKVNVEEINVIVNDELGVIPDAYVVYNEDDSISVTLPEGKTISHANRFTVTVLDSAGNPISGKPVSVTDLIETSYTGITDESGRLIVPPVTEDYTDSEGKGVANGYNVLITDETKPIENVFITIADGKLSVQLPEGVLFDIENRITATVTDSGTKLILPHNLTDFLLVLDCDDELELLPPDNDDLTIEPLGSVRETYAVNLFRIQKPLFAPGVPTRTVELKFRRKGLNNVYPEDRILVTLSANPVDLEGEISFDTKSYSFDFDRYVDNELGRFTVPSDKKLTVEFEAGEDPWLKLAPSDEESHTLRVLGGWKPNDPTADGRIQRATLVICNAADGSEREEYQISRRNYGLPVTWFHGVWWCKYNARGNSKSFDDQILCASDPAVAAGKSVLDYLRDCTPEEFYDLWGWAYQGDSGIGLRVVEQNGTVVMEGFSSSVSAHINKLPADALAPDGYELPSMEEFNRMFDATDYVWLMWSGSHLLRNPWEGHSKVIREQRRRNDLSVGTVQTPDLIYIGMSSPDFPDFEPVTWYGPGAQWNADGIKHANHYNNILFAVHSPEGTGWYMAGNISALYLQKNGAGNKDTRILRFKKSPVEYIYGE